LSFFDLVLLVGGAVGILLGAWPLLSGKNYPGIFGRGFTESDNVRLLRAPASYFRAMGATIATAGLVVCDLGVILWLSSARSVGGAGAVTVGAIAGIGLAGFFGSFAWLLLLTYRHKLFRWNAP
jgi:multisubunit Na+/H+ antiporter MnhG subunit